MNDDRVAHQQLVTTIREKCRMCYTCVRECPAKAIQILDGQAERHPDALHRLRQLRHGLQPERQAGPQRHRGHRARCSPAPRRWRRSSPRATRPSSPTATPSTLVAALRELGFTYVHEVGFGADLVAAEYARLLETTRRPLRRHHLPGRRQLRRASTTRICSTAWRPSSRRCSPSRACCTPSTAPTLEDRLHRPLHRQEGRGPVRAVRGRGRRRAHLRRAARHVRDARHHPGRAAREPTTTSTRRTAASAPSSPSPAACCRRPTSTRTC